MAYNDVAGAQAKLELVVSNVLDGRLHILQPEEDYGLAEYMHLAPENGQGDADFFLQFLDAAAKKLTNGSKKVVYADPALFTDRLYPRVNALHFALTPHDQDEHSPESVLIEISYDGVLVTDAVYQEDLLNAQKCLQEEKRNHQHQLKADGLKAVYMQSVVPKARRRVLELLAACPPTDQQLVFMLSRAKSLLWVEPDDCIDWSREGLLSIVNIATFDLLCEMEAILTLETEAQ